MQFCIRLCPFFFFFSVCPSYIHIHHIKLVSRDSSLKAKRKREIEKFVSSANNVERVGIEYHRRLRESIIKLEKFSRVTTRTMFFCNTFNGRKKRIFWIVFHLSFSPDPIDKKIYNYPFALNLSIVVISPFNDTNDSQRLRFTCFLPFSSVFLFFPPFFLFNAKQVELC